MWINRPIYESLPYAYMLFGVGLLAASWLIRAGPWPTILLLVGALSLLAGLVIWLRRRDSRTLRAEYNDKSLDE